MAKLNKDVLGDYNPLSVKVTTIEIILAILVLGVILSIFLSIYWMRQEKLQALANKQEQDILTIENALILYKLDNGFYPSQSQGLSALINKPQTEPIPVRWSRYLKTIPTDPWGNAYQYAHPGKKRTVEVFTYQSKQ